MLCRLISLFPKLDVSPTDGFVTESELTEWNMQSSAKEVMHRTQRDMDVHDRNKDGFISFSEYEPPSWVRNSGELTRVCVLLAIFMQDLLDE